MRTQRGQPEALRWLSAGSMHASHSSTSGVRPSFGSASQVKAGVKDPVLNQIA